jgi:hypothetical protein
MVRKNHEFGYHGAMKPTRRNFLQFATLAPTTMIAGVAAAASAAPIHTRDADLVRSSFTPLVGADFEFEKSALEKASARLLSVETLECRMPTQDPEGAFRLVFQAADGQSLDQRTFSVTHPSLGRFALFVSPNDAEGRVVEAIFNRL